MKFSERFIYYHSEDIDRSAEHTGPAIPEQPVSQSGDYGENQQIEADIHGIIGSVRNITHSERKLSVEQEDQLFSVLRDRFITNMDLHPDVRWVDVLKRLQNPENKEKLWALNEMERTGGEPDVTGFDQQNNKFIFVDCVKEGPSERRGAYDYEGQELIEEILNKLDSSKRPRLVNAVDMAASMGVDLLSEEEYGALQKLRQFDAGGFGCWLKTPHEVRENGRALCGRSNNDGRSFEHVGSSVFRSVGVDIASVNVQNSNSFRGILRI